MTFREFTKGKPFSGSVYASADIPGVARRGEKLSDSYENLTVVGYLLIPKRNIRDIYVK